VYDPWVNEVLHRSANPLRVHPHRYRLPDVLAGPRQLRWREGNVLVNEEKVRLLTDLTPAAIGAGAGVRVQVTDYLSSLCSSELTGEVLVGPAGGRGVAVADLAMAGDRLVPLPATPLSAHLGASTVMVTLDHHVLVQHHGEQQVAARRLVVGGSGSVDAGLLREPGPWTLQGLITAGMEQEAWEELGTAPVPGGTFLTGVARFAHRGGKPEAFGLTITSTPAARARPVEAHPKSTRLDAIPFTPTLAGLIQALESLQQDPSLAFCSLAETRFAVTFLTRADNRQLALLRIDP
jgi:hypothetical protein